MAMIECVDADIMDLIASAAGADRASGQLPGWFVDVAGRVGYECEEARSRLIHVGRQLADRVEAPAAGLVREFAGRLESARVRVAVIGEAKPDASAFVYAFAGRPELLPTAVESRATSVTRVHFNDPDERPLSASFRFYSEDDWHRLAADGGRLGAMSQQLGLGFDFDLYRSQLTELRALARQRLGTDVNELLGHQRRYDLDAAGRLVPRAGSVGGQPIESYADIIKSAEIHLGTESFVCPLTLIATPGVNDPFLVRDEITLDSVEGADACVLVVPARQVLASADGDLLRIVHALRRDRLLVFLDRVDELDEPSRQAARALDQMRALLRRELQADIQVIAGSTRWAAVALQSPECGAAFDPAPWAYAKAIGVVTAKDLDDILTGPIALRAGRLAPLLHATSGFPQIYGHIAALIRRSTIIGSVRDAAAAFSAIAGQTEGAARGELNALEESVKIAHHNVMTDSWELHRLKSEITRLDDVLGRLNRVFDSRRAALERLRQEGTRQLRQQLQDTVKDYVKRERTAMVLALDQKIGKVGLRFDVSGMRVLLEQTFLNAFRKLHQDLTEAEESAAVQLQRLLDQELPGLPAAPAPTPLSGSFVYPPLTALGQIGTFDIDPKLWSRWRRVHPTIQEAIEEFERALAMEFLAIGDELAGIAERETAARVAALIERLSLTWTSTAQAAVACRHELQTRVDDIQSALEPQAIERFLREQVHRLSECRDRLVLFVGLTRSLRELSDGMAAPEHQAQKAV